MNPGLPGSDFCHVPNFGTRTGCQLPAAVRSNRSKRIHMRRVRCRAGIWPTKTAKRSVASGPVWQSVSFAFSGRLKTGACAAAGIAATKAMQRAVNAVRRTPLFNRGVRQKLQRYVCVYSGPSPPSGGVRRPPLAVIAPHWTQFV